MSPGFFAIFASFATLACAGDATRDPGVTTTVDTIAGAVHIRHSGVPPVHESEPVFTLGELGGLGESSPEEFGRIRGLVADGDGRIYVGDGQALEVRVFGPDGAFLRRLGGKGAGPGEIGGLHGIAWAGRDSLVVLDYANARLMLVDATTGEQLDQWRWARITGGMRFLYNGGPREFFTYFFRRGEGGGSEAIWVRYTPEGAQDTLVRPRLDGSLPGTGVLCRAGGAISSFTNPHGDRFIVSPAPGGERIVGMASSYRLAFLDRAGDTVRVLTREAEPVALTDEDWMATDTAYQTFRETWHGADCEGSIERPADRPILQDIFFDHYGRLMVEWTRPEGTALDLYDHDYRLLATIALPDRDRSEAPFLRDDRLYLVTRDTLGVQQVQVFGLDGEA